MADLTGFRPLGRTAAYEILIDEADLGLILHKLFTTTNIEGSIQVAVPKIKWMQFYWRTDWPKHTLVFCTDVGQDGSYWRYNGTKWLVDREFMLGTSQGSVAAQALKFSNALTGYKSFAQLQTPRFFFASTGRRFHVQARVLRGSGAVNAPSTQIVMDGVPLYTFAWDIAGNMREQVVDTYLTFPDDINITAGAVRRVATSMNRGQPNAGTLAAAMSTDSAAFATLENIVHTLSVGISDTGSNGATYALIDLRFACQA